MTRTARKAPGARISGALALLMLVLAIACTPIYRDTGYAPTERELAALTVGKDTRETVAAAVGRPSASGLLDDVGWFYVQSRYRTYGPEAPREIDRQVVAITFTESGVVQNIERFGLEDGRAVVISRRVTESNIKGITLAQQLLGNIGRFSAADLIGDDG